MNYQYSEGASGSLSPVINPEIFNGVILAADGYISGDGALGVSYFEGKSSVIRFERIGSNVSVPIITQIALRPAPTMNFLNPRPATGSLPYPWSWDGGEHNHYIKLPLPLTYLELSQGSQIVVSGVTDSLNVIQGVVEENNEIHFRAGGALIASVVQYNGERDLVQIIVMEEFTGEILAVSFDKAYKNVSYDTLNNGNDGKLSYLNGQNQIAICTLNGVVISNITSYIPSNGLLGNLVFQSQYIQDYGNVIESYYWANNRYLYIIQVSDDRKLFCLNIDNTNSPLHYPVF